MSTQQRTARRPGPTVPRRMRRWADKLMNLNVNSSASSTFDLTNEFTANETAGLTVVRMILCYSLRAATPGAVSGQQVVDIGVGLFEAEAFAAGVLPDVQSEADYPRGGWLYRCRHLAVDETLANGPMPMLEVNKDIRSQRRLGGPDVALGVLVRNDPLEGTTFSIRVVGIIRTLYLLP